MEKTFAPDPAGCRRILAAGEAARQHRICIFALHSGQAHSGTSEGWHPGMPRSWEAEGIASFRSRFLAAYDHRLGPPVRLEPQFSPIRRFHRTHVSGLSSDLRGSYAPRVPSTLVVANVARHGSSARTLWRWFEIDAQWDMPATVMSALLSWSDDAGLPVREEHFSIGPGLPGISINHAGDTTSDLKTLVLSPFFLHHDGDGYQIANVRLAPSFRLRGETRFSMEEVARMKTLHVGLVQDEMSASHSYSLAAKSSGTH